MKLTFVFVIMIIALTVLTVNATIFATRNPNEVERQKRQILNNTPRPSNVNATNVTNT